MSKLSMPRAIDLEVPVINPLRTLSMAIGQGPEVDGPPGSTQYTEERQKQFIQSCTEFPVHIVKRKCIVPSALVRNIFRHRCKEKIIWTGFILYLIDRVYM